MRPSIRHLASVAALLLVGNVSAMAEDAPISVEERLRKLEATVNALQAENAALRREVGTATGVVAVPVGRENRLAIGGYMQAQAEFGDAADSRWAGVDDRFYFRRARMFMTGTFAENFEFKVEGEFAGNSLSATTGLRASANELFIGWTRFPEANIRFGQIKPAFGSEQLQSETRMLTIERFLASDRLTDSRQVGMSVAGTFLGKRLSYLVVVGNGNGPNVSANDNNKFMHTARVAVVPFDNAAAGKLLLAVNGMHSDDAAVNRPGLRFDSVPGGALDNTFAGRRTAWGADALWHRDRWDASAEFLQADFKPRSGIPAPHFTAQGWQVMTGYMVVPSWLQTVVRYESFDPNTSVVGDQTSTWTTGVNFLFKGDDLRLMVDYLFGHNADNAKDRGRLLTRFQVLY